MEQIKPFELLENVEPSTLQAKQRHGPGLD